MLWEFNAGLLPSLRWVSKRKGACKKILDGLNVPGELKAAKFTTVIILISKIFINSVADKK